MPPLFLPPSPPPPVNYHPRPFMYHPEGISEQPPELFPSAVVDGRGSSRAEKRAIALIQLLPGWLWRITLTVRTFVSNREAAIPQWTFFFAGGLATPPYRGRKKDNLIFLKQAPGIKILQKAGTKAQANRQGRSGCMGSGMRSMETRSQSGAHPKGKERKIQWRGRHRAAPGSSLGLSASLGEASSYFLMF